MKLPNAGEAVVPRQKITDYLLSFQHPAGRGKAGFFSRFGFSADAWVTLAEALRQHAATHDVTTTEDTPLGTRYRRTAGIQWCGRSGSLTRERTGLGLSRPTPARRGESDEGA